ncbi:MAG: DNA primase, partial [Bryobacteraceae bacterium]
LCPFHTEKRPSFRVHSNHQFYKCFGCGVGGDVFKFVQEMERLSFFEALKLLADRAGIPMPKRSDHTDAETRLRAALYQMHEIAESSFRANLHSPAGADAIAYLRRRGLADREIEVFGLGYAEGNGRALLRLLESKGFTAEQLEQSGLVRKRQDGSGFFDGFRHRLMFPIHSESGKVIGFGGRALTDAEEPKYLNSPETPIYKKSFTLYNLHRAKEGIRKQDRTVLVEGYMDVIGVYAAGVHEVVATCGTALTAQQVQAMKRHSGRIVVNFDPDPAGIKAAEKSIQMLLDEGLQIRILELEGGLDPDEYCKAHGAEGYRDALDKARGYFHWLADRARSRHDVRTPEGRVAAFQFLLPAVQRLSDKIERASIAGDVASYLGVSSGLVRENFLKAVTERQERPMAVPPLQVSFVEQGLLHLLLHSAEARDRLIPEIDESGVLEHLSMRPVFEVILKLYRAGGEFGLSDVDARLDEADRGRLASTILADETEAAEYSIDRGIASLRTLQRQAEDVRRSGVRARITEAERAGNLDQAMRLTQELDAMRKQR